MPSAVMIASLLGMYVTGFLSGPGAYYNRVNLAQVCEYRNEQGWGPRLNCERSCLAAWGKHDAEMLGALILADLPGCGLRLCEVVDVRAEADEASNGHIVIEIDGGTAQDCGWQGPIEGVRIWRLGEQAKKWNGSRQRTWGIGW